MTEQQLIDRRARLIFSERVQRLLKERGQTTNWLRVQTGDDNNKMYPAVRGETNVSAGLIARIAVALGVSANDLLPIEEIIPDRAKPHQKPSTAKKVATKFEKSAAG